MLGYKFNEILMGGCPRQKRREIPRLRVPTEIAKPISEDKSLRDAPLGMTTFAKTKTPWPRGQLC